MDWRLNLSMSNLKSYVFYILGYSAVCLVEKQMKYRRKKVFSIFRLFYLYFIQDFYSVYFENGADVQQYFQLTMQGYISEDITLNNHCCEYFIFYMRGIYMNKAVYFRFSACFSVFVLVYFGNYSSHTCIHNYP